MDVYRILGRDALAQLYAEEVLRLGVTQTGVERTPMRNAEARITLAVIAERAATTRQPPHAHAALESARKSLPSLRMVATELVQEFEINGNQDDPEVQQFVQPATTPRSDRRGERSPAQLL